MSNTIEFNQKATFQTSGNTTNPKQIWIVLHGYGQLAQFFIRKFKSLENKNTLIVAPEGLHRFYLKGTNGRVGASWMTKENRELDIENYITYLSAIIHQLKALYGETVQLNILGFSQGAATASRIFNTGDFNFNKFVLWSAVFPPDLDFEVFDTQLKDSKAYFIYGTEDEYFGADVAKKMVDKVRPYGFQVITFEGPHNIDTPTLELLKEV